MEGAKDLIKDHLPHIFLAIMFSVGIAGHLISPLYSLMITLTPYTLLLTGITVLYNYRNELRRDLIIWFMTVFVCTFFLEVIGVKTGLIFGKYEYTTILGFSIFSVPLIIGFNWAIIILGSVIIAGMITKRRIAASLIAALIALSFDFLLEPIAIKLSYWQWENNNVPIQNYVAWFSIAFFSSISYFNTVEKVNNKLASFYLFVQFIFFLTLNLFL
ncbi:MAG TPA: carotenoid biosynthesis protein [Ignavibacteriaceae bacterium]|nr:carotenoid biosynthesis protein [Ignavibacteriaceae bacterium]